MIGGLPKGLNSKPINVQTPPILMNTNTGGSLQLNRLIWAKKMGIEENN